MNFEVLAQAQTNFTDEPARLYQLDDVFARVLNAVSGFALLLLLVMVIYGGFNFLTSGGDPGKVESAKKTLTYAFYGIALISLAYLILRTIQALTGIDTILEFSVFQ
jgi:hypothetical protein